MSGIRHVQDWVSFTVSLVSFPQESLTRICVFLKRNWHLVTDTAQCQKVPHVSAPQSCLCMNRTGKHQIQALQMPWSHGGPFSAGPFLGRTDVLTLSRGCWELSQLLANGLKAFLEPWGVLWGHWPILQDYIWYSSVAMTTKGRWHWGDRGRGEAAGHSFPKLVPRGEADGWPALCRNREPSPE